MESYQQQSQQQSHECCSSSSAATLALRRNSKTNSMPSISTAAQDLIGVGSGSPPQVLSPPVSDLSAQGDPDHQLHNQHHLQQAMHRVVALLPRRHAPLLWTVLLACCVALASSFNVLPPLFSRAFDHTHLRRRRQEMPSLLRAVTTAAANAPTTTARQLAIFRDDDRRPVSDPMQYPYSAVGLLRWTDALRCTATLIGERFIVTAAECVLDANGDLRPTNVDAPPQFLPGYSAKTPAVTVAPGASAGILKVHKQSDYWKKWTQNTYVILELDALLGQRFGVLALPTLGDLDQSSGTTDVQLAGYGDDDASGRATMQYSKCTCFFPTGASGPQYLLRHDCDTSIVGSPGSPLLVRYSNLKTYVIGIHSNAIGTNGDAATTSSKYDVYTPETANRGVLGPFVQKQLAALEAAIAAAGSSSTLTSGSLGTAVGKTPRSSSASTAAPSTDDTANPRGRIDDNQVQPGASIPSGGSNSNNGRISPSAAYSCLAVVGLAWATIGWIAMRHVRHSGNELTTAELAMDDIME